MFVSHFQRSMETAAIQGLRARFAHTAPGYLIPRGGAPNLSFCAKPSNVSFCCEKTSVFSTCPHFNCAKLRSFSRSEEHTSELQSRLHLVCRLLLEKKKNNDRYTSQQKHKSNTPKFTPFTPHTRKET